MIKLPSFISGDGRTFVEQLKAVISQIQTSINQNIQDNVKNVTLEEVWDTINGKIVNNLVVSFEYSHITDFAYAEVYRIKNGVTSYIGASDGKYAINDVKRGEQYTIKVIAVTKFNQKSALGSASSVTKTIIGSRNTISEPKNFALTFNSSGVKLQWDSVTDSDLAGYELRTDEYPGSIEHVSGLIQANLSTTTYNALPNKRINTIYVFSKNTNGYYSLPTSVNFEKPLPYSPSGITIKKSGTNVIVSFNPIPYDCTGANIYVNGIVQHITTNTITLDNSTNTLSTIQLAYTDYFGEGALSESISLVPDEITWFTATQSKSDRSLINLKWNPIIDSNFSHYTLKIGADFDTATVIIDNIKESNYEFKATEQKLHTFWVVANNVTQFKGTPKSFALQVYLVPNPPETVTITQSLNDKSLLTVSWSQVTDTDLKEYIVKVNGNVLVVTRETSYTYRIGASGTYTFSVCAKNFAGYESSYTSKSFIASLIPSDVTNFLITINATDRRILRLSWTPISDGDFSHYEIRKGDGDWDTAIVSATRVKSNFYDLSFTGGTATFQIKAVNLANNYSEIPATYTIICPAEPSVPGAGSVIADPTNRLHLYVSWEGTTDTDLAGYECRIGATWATATLITITKETGFFYTVTAGGAYTFHIASKTIGGIYSVPRTLTTNVIQEPSDVPNFTATISTLDRRTINLTWGTITDSDFASFELRKGNGSWDTATVLATGLKVVKYEYTATTEETATFQIKAITVAGKYSVNAKTSTVIIQLKPNPPTNLDVEQDENNSIIQVISWTGVDDADLQFYEIRSGGTSWSTATVITTTKEVSYRHTVKSNNSIKYYVASKNIGGYYSTPVSVTVVPFINPQNVNNFDANQLANDHSKIRLTWSAVSNKDFSHFMIKEGATWDTATTIADRVTGVFYDAVINVERQYNYLIKAFNTNGYCSLDASIVTDVFNMNPSPVTSIQLAQNTNDKSVLNIMWSDVIDGDLAGYQVKIGNVWESAEALPLTKELYTSYYLRNTGNITVLIKTVNAAGFYSDEVSASLYCKVEPANVTGFIAYQNGETVELFWDKATEADVTGYEIYEGIGFEQGNLVATGITQQSYITPVDTEREYRYHIKAINRSGHYSQSSVTVSAIVTNLPVKNVISTYDEIALANGIHNNTEFGTSLINWSNIGGKWSNYPLTKFSDVGGKNVLKLKPKNLISDYHFDNSINTTSWLPYSGGTITKNANGNLLYTVAGSVSTGVKFKLPSVLERNAVYVVEFKFKSSKTSLSSGFLGVNDSYASSNCIPTSKVQTYTAGTWQTEIMEFTVGSSGVEPTSFLFSYGSKVAGDTIELEYAKIYKKSGQTGSYTYESSGTYTPARIDVGQIITANITTDFVSTAMLKGSVYATLKMRTSQGNTVAKTGTVSATYTGTYTTGQTFTLTQNSGTPLMPDDIMTWANDGLDYLQVLSVNGSNVTVLALRNTNGGTFSFTVKSIVFTDWQDFKPAQYTFRYIDLQVCLGTTNTAKTPEVNQITIRVDVPDFDIAKTATIAVGGTTINYGHEYYTIPVVTPTAVGENLHAQLISKTKTSCVVKIKNASNTDVGGQIDLRVKGY